PRCRSARPKPARPGPGSAARRCTSSQVFLSIPLLFLQRVKGDQGGAGASISDGLGGGYGTGWSAGGQLRSRLQGQMGSVPRGRRAGRGRRVVVVEEAEQLLPQLVVARVLEHGGARAGAGKGDGHE